MGNPFVHAELMSTNPQAAKEFYGKLFDWKFEEIKGGGDNQYFKNEDVLL